MKIINSVSISKRWAFLFGVFTCLLGIMGLLSLIPGMGKLGSFRIDYPNIPIFISVMFVILGSSLSIVSVKDLGERVKYSGYIIFTFTSFAGIFCLTQDLIQCPITFVTMILAAAALCLIYLRDEPNYSAMGDWAGGISSLVLIISAIFIFSFVFSAPFLLENDYVSIGVNAAIGFFFLSAGIVFLIWQEHFPGRLLSGNETQALLFRSFMPIMIPFVIVGAVIFKLTEILDLQSGNFLSFFLVGFIVLIIVIYAYTSSVIGKSIDSAESLRRNAEADLLQTEKKFRIIFDNSDIGIVLLDKEGFSIVGNSALLRMLGYTEEELCGKKFTEFTHPDDVETDLKFYADLINAEINSYNIEKRFINKSGEIIWGNLYVTLDRENGGPPTAVIGMLEDITERKDSEKKLREYSDRLEDMVEERTVELFEAQEQLVRKERLAVIGEMAGGISHELRNPLASISNAAYYLKMVLKDYDENIIKYIDIISKEVTSSEKIISSLLDYTRIQATNQEKCDIKNLVQEVLISCDIKPEIKVTEHISDNIPAIFVDRDQIKQVMVNLVVNAVQAMPDGGDLEISAVLNESRVFISVKDNGIGIKKSNMKRLFEPLFSTKSKGIGLGLALSQKITGANGGVISVESEEGVGTTFTVTLPKN